ncbi:MAG: hypothetical protein WAU75_24505, partial [Solirubrobacteraceae bacterium]
GPGEASGADGAPRTPRMMAARALRPQVIPMDPKIAPMAADSFSRMASDHDASDPDHEPRADGESADAADAE